MPRYPVSLGRGNRLPHPTEFVGSEKPHLFSLLADPSFALFREGSAGWFEYKTLVPICYYLQNFLVHLELVAPDETAEEALEDASWRRMVNTVREITEIALFRRDQLVVYYKGLGTDNAGLSLYLEAARNEGKTVGGHEMMSSTSVGLVSNFNEKLTVQTLKEVAKGRKGTTPHKTTKPGTAEKSTSGAGTGRPAQK